MTEDITPLDGLGHIEAVRTLEVWADDLRGREIPIQAQTAEHLQLLCDTQDRLDANALGEVVAVDPLMTLRLFVHAAEHRSARMVTPPETVVGALLMMGITPFFAAFSGCATIDQQLGTDQQALRGLENVLRRAHRAANFALGFAVHRGDHDAAALHLGALLHDFAEMLVWCHAPRQALAICHRLGADSTLRSAAVQQQVLGVAFADLQHVLMTLWNLPELLVHINDERHGGDDQVKCVLLATRVARHSANGWDNAAIPDDITGIAALLNLSPTATKALLLDIDS